MLQLKGLNGKIGRPGDLVMWDNRCTVHRGRRFDLSARRELRRVTSEEVEAAA